MRKSQAPYWGEFIAQLRQTKCLTQGQLANLLDTDQATISRWECGISEPRIAIRQKLESLAKDTHGVTLAEAINLVRSSPFPMLLVSQTHVILAASASSGFQEGKTNLEQTPEAERACLQAYQAELEQSGFWQMQAPRLDYAYNNSEESRKAVVTSISIAGETYALVQKAW